MEVLVVDPNIQLSEAGFEQLDHRAMLPRAHFVVCLANATDATRNLVSRSVFQTMRSDSYFLNLSRGDLVDEIALAEAVTAGLIAGAAIHVGKAADEMPTPDIAALPNVLATPHIGGATPEATGGQAFETVAQISALVSGCMPVGAINAPDWARR